jgi:hypothetical protein
LDFEEALAAWAAARRTLLADFCPSWSSYFTVTFAPLCEES